MSRGLQGSLYVSLGRARASCLTVRRDNVTIRHPSQPKAPLVRMRPNRRAVHSVHTCNEAQRGAAVARQWERALEELLRERGALLFGYSFMLTGDFHAAEDALQDALVRVFRSRAAFPSIDAAHSYVKRAIASTVVDRRRELARRSEAAVRSEDLERVSQSAVADHSGRTDDALTLAAALRTLAHRERTCVVLHYLDGLTIAEISDALGIAPGTVKRYLSDARTRLQQAMPSLDLESTHSTVSVARNSGARP